MREDDRVKKKFKCQKEKKKSLPPLCILRVDGHVCAVETIGFYFLLVSHLRREENVGASIGNPPVPCCQHGHHPEKTHSTKPVHFVFLRAHLTWERSGDQLLMST